MSLSTDIRYAAETARLIEQALTVEDREGRRVLDRVRDGFAGGVAASQILHIGTSGSGHSDPTATAALRAAEWGDRAATDMKELNRLAGEMRRASERMVAILCNYVPRPAGDREKAATADPNDPHCESCQRVKWWVEPSSSSRTTRAGRLKEPLWLCDWCAAHVDQKGCIPTEDEVSQYRDGTIIRCFHPDLTTSQPPAITAGAV